MVLLIPEVTYQVQQNKKDNSGNKRILFTEHTGFFFHFQKELTTCNIHTDSCQNMMIQM